MLIQEKKIGVGGDPLLPQVQIQPAANDELVVQIDQVSFRYTYWNQAEPGFAVFFFFSMSSMDISDQSSTLGI